MFDELAERSLMSPLAGTKHTYVRLAIIIYCQILALFFKNRRVSLNFHGKYKYFDSTVQGAEDRRQKFYFCRLPFAVNVMLNLSNDVRIYVMVTVRI